MSSYNYFIRGQVGHEPDTTRRVIVEVDASYIPLAISALEGRKPRSFWASDADYAAGVAGICKLQEDLLMGIEDITPALNRVYMALRQMSAGEQFYLDGNGNQPELPLVPPALTGDITPGLLHLVRDGQGTLDIGWFNGPARPATNADIVRALRVGEEDQVQGLLDKLDLLGDAGDVTAIYNAVKGSAVDLAALTEGGGTLITLIVATMSQAAMMGLQAGQLDTLIAKMTDLLDLLQPPTLGGVAALPETGEE
jgi:hypothetical protein